MLNCHQHQRAGELGLLNTTNIIHFRSTLAIDLIMGGVGSHACDEVLKKLPMAKESIDGPPTKLPKLSIPLKPPVT